MALGNEWCTIPDVQVLLAEPYPPDEDITAAIQLATSSLGAAFCTEPVDILPDDGPENPGDGYPDDWNVRQACATLAAQLLTAAPPSSGAGEGITGEAIGGYSYQTRFSKTSLTALRIDGYVKELVLGYLCPGETGVFEMDVLKYRHPLDDVELESV